MIWYDFVSNRKLACWVKTLRLGQRWHPSAFRVASQHQELAYLITSAGIYVASECYPIWRNGGDSVGISLHVKTSNFQHVWVFLSETTHLEKAIRALKGHVILAIFWLCWLQLWQKPWDTLWPCPLGHARPNVLCHARRARGERAGALQSLVWQGLRCGSVWDRYW